MALAVEAPPSAGSRTMLERKLAPAGNRLE
jgi:hypothetical protein